MFQNTSQLGRKPTLIYKERLLNVPILTAAGDKINVLRVFSFH